MAKSGSTKVPSPSSSLDEQGACWYEDDDGCGFGIQTEGNVLTFVPANPDTGARDQFEGTLVLQGACGASYELTLGEVRYPPPG